MTRDHPTARRRYPSTIGSRTLSATMPRESREGLAVPGRHLLDHDSTRTRSRARSSRHRGSRTAPTAAEVPGRTAFFIVMESLRRGKSSGHATLYPSRRSPFTIPSIANPSKEQPLDSSSFLRISDLQGARNQMVTRAAPKRPQARIRHTTYVESSPPRTAATPCFRQVDKPLAAIGGSGISILPRLNPYVILTVR